MIALIEINKEGNELIDEQYVLLMPRNFSRGRGVIPSLAEQGEQSCQRGYYQFGMLRLGVRSGV
jgi:hypothetical protein